jgi:hypothetical protein
MQMNVTPFTVDWYEAMKTAFDAVDIKNVDRILIKLSPQPPPMMGDMMGGQMPGQAPPQQEMQNLQSVPYGGQQL